MLVFTVFAREPSRFVTIDIATRHMPRNRGG